MRAPGARLALALWLIALGTSGVAAASLRGQDSRVAVRVDGRAVLRVGQVDTVSAAERALRIERRLNQLLATQAAIQPARVAVDPADTGSRVISVTGARVVDVRPADAADNLRSVDAVAADWSRALDSALTAAHARRRSAWRRFATEVGASITAALGRMAESAIRIVPRVFAALLVLATFWTLAGGIRWLLRLALAGMRNRTVANLIRQLVYYTVWILGLLVTVDALGFQAQTVVTGLGLTGLALGFALKDIISNFVSGLLILALRPFQLGDQIVVGDTEGSVEHIRLRATDIRTYDGRLVLVPNADVFTSRVTNNTASPIRRAVVTFYLGYDADLRSVIAIAERAVRATDNVLDQPPAVVRIRDLGEADIEFEARFWTDSRRSDFTATRAAVRQALGHALQDAGVTLPNPDLRVTLLNPGDGATTPTPPAVTPA